MIIPWYVVLAVVLGYFVAGAFFARSRFTKWHDAPEWKDNASIEVLFASLAVGLVWPGAMVTIGFLNWFTKPLDKAEARENALMDSLLHWQKQATRAETEIERQVAAEMARIIREELGLSDRLGVRGPAPKPKSPGYYRHSWDDPNNPHWKVRG